MDLNILIFRLCVFQLCSQSVDLTLRLLNLGKSRWKVPQWEKTLDWKLITCIDEKGVSTAQEGISRYLALSDSFPRTRCEYQWLPASVKLGSSFCGQTKIQEHEVHLNGRRSLAAIRASIWRSLSPTYGFVEVQSSLKLCLYQRWQFWRHAGTNLLLHLLHLHLASLVVGLVEPQLRLGASQLVLGFLKLVLQFGVLHGAVDPEGPEPVHLRARLPLVSKISRPLQLNVHPAITMYFTFLLLFPFKVQPTNVSEQTQVLLLQPRNISSSIEIGPFPFMASTWDFSHERLITEPEN